MRELVAVLALSALFVVWIGWSYAFMVADLGFALWRYPSRLRARRDAKRLSRIRNLEHDLGYTPCSDPECMSCGMDADARKWLYGGSRAFLPQPDPRLTEEFKR